MESDERGYRELVAELAEEGVRLVAKGSCWHQRALDLLLRIVTFGAQVGYLDCYVTTIGRTIYLTADWESRGYGDRFDTLCHERVHIAQFRRYGIVPMVVAYLLLPLPLGLAWCRMALEREAYAETVRRTFAREGQRGTDRLRAHVIRQFTSGAYGWMWPFPRANARWYDELVAALQKR